jgi:ureidoglycolate lyase
MSDAGRVLPVEPLSRDAFAPYGQLIDCAGVTPVAINAGAALKFPELALVELVGDGEAAISIFHARPRTLPMPLDEIERHPLASQPFVPLQPTRFLVLVAGTGERPRPEEVRLFLATGQQGVNFRAGVWHHSLLALDRDCDFLVVDRRSAAGNLERVETAPWRLTIAI